MKIIECKKGNKNQLDICKTCIKRGIFCFSPYKWYPKDFNIKSLTRGIINVDDCLLIMPELESKKVLKLKEDINKLDDEITNIVEPYMDRLLNDDELYNKMKKIELEIRNKNINDNRFINNICKVLKDSKTSDGFNQQK